MKKRVQQKRKRCRKQTGQLKLVSNQMLYGRAGSIPDPKLVSNYLTVNNVKRKSMHCRVDVSPESHPECPQMRRESPLQNKSPHTHEDLKKEMIKDLSSNQYRHCGLPSTRNRPVKNNMGGTAVVARRTGSTVALDNNPHYS